MRKYGVKIIEVGQSHKEMIFLAVKNAAFVDWLERLNHKDKLPRGKWFKGKKGGSPRMIFADYKLINQMG